MRTLTAKKGKWKCEWHSDEAYKAVARKPRKAKIMYCGICGLATWHGLVKEQNSQAGKGAEG